VGTERGQIAVIIG